MPFSEGDWIPRESVSTSQSKISSPQLPFMAKEGTQQTTAGDLFEEVEKLICRGFQGEPGQTRIVFIEKKQSELDNINPESLCLQRSSSRVHRFLP